MAIASFPSLVYEAEKPSEREIERLSQKYGRIRPKIVQWDQTDVDFRQDMENPRCHGEVVLLIHDAGGRLAVVRGKGSAPGAFDLPTGIIEEGERVEEVARREALEETGAEVRVDDLVAIYRVRVRWKAWNLERWFFVLRCLALSDVGPPRDTKEIEEAKFIRPREELPASWSRNEWWGGVWRRRILEDSGFL